MPPGLRERFGRAVSRRAVCCSLRFRLCEASRRRGSRSTRCLRRRGSGGRSIGRFEGLIGVRRLTERSSGRDSTRSEDKSLNLMMFSTGAADFD